MCGGILYVLTLEHCSPQVMQHYRPQTLGDLIFQGRKDGEGERDGNGGWERRGEGGGWEGGLGGRGEGGRDGARRAMRMKGVGRIIWYYRPPPPHTHTHTHFLLLTLF